MPRIATLLAASAATLAFGVTCASAVPGDLDRGFGNRGVVRTYNSSEARALALQQNGRIVAVGSWFFEAIEIDRYLRGGDLDPTFGNGGRARLLDDGGYVNPAAAGIDSVGRIVVAGALEGPSPQTDIVIIRVLPSGDLDTSFGDQGVVVLNPGGDDGAVGLELRPDDSILVGGYVSGFSQDPASIVARIDDQGDLDSDYGDGGVATVPLGSVAAMAADARGREMLAEGFPGPDQTIQMVRLTPGGELDDSFSGNGRRTLDLGRRERVRALAIGKRGRILVGGSVAQGRNPRRTSHSNLALARLNSNGSINRRFGRRGRRGIVTTDLDLFDTASDIVPQADGKIVVSAVGDHLSPGDYPQRWAVLRYRKSGKLDRFFSGNGRAFPKPRIYGSPPLMEMQPNGRILLLGYSWPDELADPDGFVLARMRNDGRPLGG
jgi:uncharacterized delta-60 repeat protein